MLANRINGTVLSPFQSLSRELDRMFEGVTDGSRYSTAVPPVVIWEDEDSFHLEAHVPGIRSDDLDIAVTGNRVSLKGARPATKRDKVTVHRDETTPMQFERTFELPTDVDTGKLTADLSDGVLHLTLPKAPQHKPVKIRIGQQA